MPFISSKKVRQTSPVINNEFAWTNDLSFYDSLNNPVDLSFLDIPEKVVLYDEHNNLINTENTEYPEQCLSQRFVSPDATVLELGARYGSVSCIINKKLQDKTKQVSVEPDPSVWGALEKNIQINGCSVNIHKGFVSKAPRDLLLMGYASRTVSSDKSTNVSASVEELQIKYNLTFDTLVADCEGFLETLFDEHPFLYQQLHTVIFEADFPNYCNYPKIRTALKEHGFREIIHGFQNVYKK
jgi:FkbM family methyltransferase